MTDLSGIARHLRLSVEQIRIAADLLQQGYQPAFIEQYRADESGCLPREALWALKLEIDRQQRLATSRVRLASQLPKDSVLDDEAKSFIEKSRTELDIESALRAFRARRSLAMSQERDAQAGTLLEKLIAHSGDPITDLPSWVAEQLSVDAEAATQLLDQTQRLIASLLLCDTALTGQLREIVQRRAQVRVELCENPNQDGRDTAAEAEPAQEASSEAAPAASDPAAAADAAAPETAVTEASVEATTSEAAAPAETPATEPAEAATETPATAEAATETPATADAETPATDAVASQATADQATADGGEAVAGSETAADGEAPAATEATAEAPPTADAGATEATGESPKPTKISRAAKKKAANAKRKPIAKLTPRQRRRRWLIAMLNPMKTLKRPLTKLTAYQQLMLGRGRRSQIVQTHLEYDSSVLVPPARDRFVGKDHPLSNWFDSAVRRALDEGVRSKVEADAVAELEEMAAEKLLTTAADGLRKTLLQRPARGHRILVIDTVGPKAAAIAIIDQTGNVLATDEIPCSALPATVNANVMRLGELAHKYRVTLVALTNGPSRRFLVHTLRELVKQSAESGLRWTMADRSGADAYAAGRTALRELSAFNRRDRAAIWVARSLQDPLTQYLKVGVNRLRLGSYQRELPQEPLKKLVRETITDCVAARGVDVHSASVSQLLCVPGVHDEQAQQIASLAAQGSLESREQMLATVTDWTDSQSRQAVGMLRIFGSPQTLDATSIHPEDYRLAQRIVDNTELQSPPAAPEGWEKPSPISPEDLAAEARAAAAEHLGDSDADGSSETVSPEAAAGDAPEASAPEGSSPEASGEASGEATQAPATESPESADSTATVDSEAPATETPTPVEAAPPTGEADAEQAATDEPAASDTAEIAQTDEAAQSSAEPPAAGTATTDAEAPATEAPAAEAAPTAKPEYPEDIAAAPVNKLPIDVEKLARGWQVGREKLRSVARALHDPFADARLNRPAIPMMQDMPTLQNLEPGMCVWAIVVGVADFGAFVELGPECSGLIHISRLSDKYIEDPHEFVQVGDLIMTWVVNVDEKKGRVALTALSPDQIAASEQQARESSHSRSRDDGDRRGSRPSGGNRDSRGGQSAGQGRPAGGQGRGQGGRGPGGGRPGGGQRGGDRRGGGGRGNSGGRPSKTVVVKSKKPVAPISSAMKDGAEPLRSFGDLMQFYEAKRTDDPAPKSAQKAPKQVTEAASPVETQPSPDTQVATQPEPAKNLASDAGATASSTPEANTPDTAAPSTDES